MKKLSFRQVLKAVNNYVVFFLTVGFAVSCCMMLFLNVLADSMGLVLDANNIGVAAKLTFGNVLLITFLFGTADYIRRKITVDCTSEALPDHTHDVTVIIKEQDKVILKTTVNVDSAERSRQMRQTFRSRPEVIYRGIMALMCGKVDYLFDKKQ